MYYKAYRYRLFPTKAQEQLLAQHFGAVRFVYNWALETKKKAWEESKSNITKFDLIKLLPPKKKELLWLTNTNAQALENAVQNLDSAYLSLFKGGGYPKFKSRKGRQSFSLRGSLHIDFDSQWINLSKVGRVRAAISRRFDGVYKAVTVTKTPTGKYYASCRIAINQELPIKPEAYQSDAIGIDLGIKTFATLSTGEVIDNPRHLNKSLKALRRASRKHSKKTKGSANREKSRRRLARLHEKVANQRNDFLHKLTTKLTRDNQAGTLCIEDLGVRGMVNFPSIARHAQDASFGTFRRMLTYKADWYGVNLKVIDRFAPSSKQCSCGVKNTALKLDQRSWSCAACGTTHDRDLLAAQNIVRFAFHPEAVVKSVIGRGTPESTPVETLALAGR